MSISGFSLCCSKSIFDLVWVCVYNMSASKQFFNLSFLSLGRKGWIMRVAWGRKRERPGRLAAAAALPDSLHSMSACVHVCVQSYSNFPLGFYSCAHTVCYWHTHTHFPLASRLRNPTSAKNVLALTFSWDGLRGPSAPITHTHSEFLDLLNNQKAAQSSRLSQLCVISLSWSERGEQEPVGMFFSFQPLEDSFRVWYRVRCR